MDDDGCARVKWYDESDSNLLNVIPLMPEEDPRRDPHKVYI